MDDSGAEHPPPGLPPGMVVAGPSSIAPLFHHRLLASGYRTPTKIEQRIFSCSNAKRISTKHEIRLESNKDETRKGHTSVYGLGPSPYGRTPHPKTRRPNLFHSVPVIHGGLCSTCHMRHGSTSSSCPLGAKKDKDCPFFSKPGPIPARSTPMMDPWRVRHPVAGADIDPKRSDPKPLQDKLKTILFPSYQLSHNIFSRPLGVTFDAPTQSNRSSSSSEKPSSVPLVPTTKSHLHYLLRHPTARRSLLGSSGSTGGAAIAHWCSDLKAATSPQPPIDGGVPLGGSIRGIVPTPIFSASSSSALSTQIPAWIKKALKTDISISWTGDGRFLVWAMRDYLILIDPMARRNYSKETTTHNCTTPANQKSSRGRDRGAETASKSSLHSSTAPGSQVRFLGALKVIVPVVHVQPHPTHPNLVIALGEAATSTLQAGIRVTSSAGKKDQAARGSLYVYDLRSLIPAKGCEAMNLQEPPKSSAVPLLVSPLQKIVTPKNCIISPCGEKLVVASGVFKQEIMEAYRVVVESPDHPAPEVEATALGAVEINEDFCESSIAFSPCGQFVLAPLKEKNMFFVYPFPTSSDPTNMSLLPTDPKGLSASSLSGRKALARPTIYTPDDQPLAKNPFANDPFRVSTGMSGIHAMVAKRQKNDQRMNNRSLFYASQSGTVVSEWSVASMTTVSQIRGLGPSSLYPRAMDLNSDGSLLAWAPELGTTEAKEFETTLMGLSSDGDHTHAKHQTVPRIFLATTNPLKPLLAVPTDYPVRCLAFHPTRPNVLMYSCVNGRATSDMQAITILTFET